MVAPYGVSFFWEQLLAARVPSQGYPKFPFDIGPRANRSYLVRSPTCPQRQLAEGEDYFVYQPGDGNRFGAWGVI